MNEMAFTGADFGHARILCPTSGEVCPAREQVVLLHDTPLLAAQYTENLPPEVSPRFDGPKMHARLAEITLCAFANTCQGPVKGVCPSRESMNNSTARTNVVGVLRKIFRKVF